MKLVNRWLNCICVLQSHQRKPETSLLELLLQNAICSVRSWPTMKRWSLFGQNGIVTNCWLPRITFPKQLKCFGWFWTVCSLTLLAKSILWLAAPHAKGAFEAAKPHFREAVNGLMKEGSYKVGKSLARTLSNIQEGPARKNERLLPKGGNKTTTKTGHVKYSILSDQIMAFILWGSHPPCSYKTSSLQVLLHIPTDDELNMSKFDQQPL